MNNIYILNESLTGGYYPLLLDVASFAAILCGVFVIVSKNPIVSVLFLIGLFLNISVYLMAIGINFIGLSYLLVYVGAVSILFLFILMLINVRISEIVSTTSNSIPSAIFIGFLFLSGVYKALPSINLSNVDENNDFTILYYGIKSHLSKYFHIFADLFSSSQVENASSSAPISIQSLALVYSDNWDCVLAEASHINVLGSTLYTSYPIWILLTSLILLLAMVGAIIITLKK